MIPPEEAARTVEFLKALADEPDAPLTDIARDFKLTTTTANRLMEEYVAKLAVASDDQNYPAKVLDYYNVNLPPDSEPLNEEDIEALTPLVDKFHKRLKRKTVPKQNISTMSSNYNPDYSSGSVPNYPGALTTEADDEAGLLKWILETTYNPRPHLIGRFIEMFKRMHHIYTANPWQLLGMLKHNFGQQAGEMAFTTWQNLRGQYVTDPNTLYQVTGAGASNPAAQGMIGPGPGMSTPPMQTPMGMSQDMYKDIQEERKWERLQKMMERKMQIDLMKTMSTINQSQTPLNVMDQNKEMVFEEYDKQTGKVIRREYKPRPDGQGGTSMDRIYELMLKQSMDRENILLSKMEQPMKWIEPVLSSIVTGHQNQTDPYAGMEKMLQIQNMLSANRPNEGAKDKEIAKWEMDTKLALAELSLKREEIKHQWDREAAEAARAESTTDKYIEGLTKTGTEILKPIVSNFAAGWAQRGGGQMAQGQPQQQMQQSPEMQMGMDPNMAAQAQQQYYQQQIAQERARAVALQRAKIMAQQAQEAKRREQQEQEMAQMGIDDQLASMNDAQVEELARKFEMQAREFETTGSKIMKEVAKRRLVNTPQRQRDERNAYVQQQVYRSQSQQDVTRDEGPIATPGGPIVQDANPRTAAVIGGDIGNSNMSADDRAQMEADGQMTGQSDTGMNFGVSVAKPQSPTEIPNEPEQSKAQVTETEEHEDEEILEDMEGEETEEEEEATAS